MLYLLHAGRICEAKGKGPTLPPAGAGVLIQQGMGTAGKCAAACMPAGEDDATARGSADFCGEGWRFGRVGILQWR